ncbi:heat shock protein HslJ [Chryseobacterium ginsenosidimutans]|uniref:META domain-containing protein n=1 Tax=Chryseobacterium ginsenosidimutans TaxID=687846 RepID=UPI0021679E48|nr:META domain-containing protein [Chryseobacterium ginsenosidimutans]MCS3867326.1 heat shock protein HslJ [Chryseobacterium ginsenosidimutans]
MKKILFTVLAVLCLSFVFNCSSVPTKNPQIQREWMLVSFENYAKQDLIKSNAKINLTSAIENGKIKGGAFMGCNNMFFSSEFKKDGKVTISEMGSTMKACLNMKLESDFSKSFKDMTNYKIEGHFLTFTDDKGNSMKFIAADWD